MLDLHIDQRFKRTWDFFVANATALLLGSLVVLAGFLVVIPAPWFAFNLLQETLECMRTGRPVRWQAAYDRPGNFLKSWGLTLAMGIPIALGFMLLVVPGVLLAILWFHAPLLAAEGRPVLESLAESGRIFQRRKDWASYFINFLVLVVLSAVAGATVLACLVTLPLSLIYLAYCHTDELGQGTVPPPSERRIIV
ncbi:hypothetical protein CYFUS_006745 [Cystobacter fuscus]|uniref:Transmembrane protein n=1 Tax=Cystobacter fuscus TaxID=43 RepID=A0A250JCH5_9BACT|nr:hypothetical protein [Cystobacter fuscus]ATB41280.1 hypothetical protein CYFUS_006745 [Cystobacter fuscus]